MKDLPATKEKSASRKRKNLRRAESCPCFETLLWSDHRDAEGGCVRSMTGVKNLAMHGWRERSYGAFLGVGIVTEAAQASMDYARSRRAIIHNELTQITCLMGRQNRSPRLTLRIWIATLWCGCRLQIAPSTNKSNTISNNHPKLISSEIENKQTAPQNCKSPPSSHPNTTSVSRITYLVRPCALPAFASCS